MDYYGSFLGIQKDFRVNVTDDLEYISSSDFFVKNIGIIYTFFLETNMLIFL